jgi:hypothetical protein
LLPLCLASVVPLAQNSSNELAKVRCNYWNFAGGWVTSRELLSDRYR